MLLALQSQTTWRPRMRGDGVREGWNEDSGYKLMGESVIQRRSVKA